MADDFGDQQPRRRLFARRKSEPTAPAERSTPPLASAEIESAPDAQQQTVNDYEELETAVHPPKPGISDTESVPNRGSGTTAGGSFPSVTQTASSTETSPSAPQQLDPPGPDRSAAGLDLRGTEERIHNLAQHASTVAAVPLELPRIIAIANQKGGVGKTTTAVNLGAALAETGLRVLVVDLDPQGNATTGLGVNPRDVSSSIYDVLMHDTPALDAIEPTSLKNLFVIPARIDLAGAEIELVPAFSRELKLRRALEPVRAEYDVVMIDCPPSLGLLTVNGLAAADDVIVPVQCEYYALEGLGQLLGNVALVRNSLNPGLDVRGIILTMFDARTRLAEQVEAEVREHFGAKVYKTVVPRTVRLSEAPSFGQPIIVFDSTSRGATAYRELAKEVSGGATRRTG